MICIRRTTLRVQRSKKIFRTNRFIFLTWTMWNFKMKSRGKLFLKPFLNIRIQIILSKNLKPYYISIIILELTIIFKIGIFKCICSSFSINVLWLDKNSLLRFECRLLVCFQIMKRTFMSLFTFWLVINELDKIFGLE